MVECYLILDPGKALNGSGMLADSTKESYVESTFQLERFPRFKCSLVFKSSWTVCLFHLAYFMGGDPNNMCYSANNSENYFPIRVCVCTYPGPLRLYFQWDHKCVWWLSEGSEGDFHLGGVWTTLFVLNFSTFVSLEKLQARGVV